MDNIKVSVIMPAYNAEKYISDTIESVLTQSHRNLELLIVDDMSKDNTRAIIKKYEKQDDRVKGIFPATNIGAGAARNQALLNMTGDYFAFIDSDDIWLDNKLEKQLRYMLTNNLEMSYTWYWNVSGEGQKLSYFVTPKKINYRLLSLNNYILTSTLMCKSSTLGNVRYPEFKEEREDWVYFLDLLKIAKYSYCLPECLTHYRKVKGSLSSNKIELIKLNYHTINKFFYNNNPPLSALHFIFFLAFYLHNKIFNRKK